MDIRFHIWGGGISVPATKFGVNLLMGASLVIRTGSTEQTFLIYDGFELGVKSGTLVAASVSTEWLSIVPAIHPWVNTCDTFKNDTFEVIFSGAIGNRGYIDLTFNKIDENHDKTTLLKKYNVEAFGGQLSETRVTGKMKMNKGHKCTLPADLEKTSFFAT